MAQKSRGFDMSDLQHVLEELRSQKAATTQLVAKMSDVCVEVRVLVTELRHTQKSYESIDSRVATVEDHIRTIQLENATNKPILDIANSMYRSQWMTILGAVAAVVGSNWSKLF
jgi:hypothetical protein